MANATLKRSLTRDFESSLTRDSTRDVRLRRPLITKAEFQIRARLRRVIKLAGVPDGAVWVAAVSGGCDSIALLHLLAEEAQPRGWRIVVGHIDHGLRLDSREDRRFVEATAEALGLPFRGFSIPPEAWTLRRGGSLEALARRLRRRRLRQLAAEARASWIALGHNRDDQAETVLMNLMRGSHVRGLSGMRAVRPPWIRPLLHVGRSEVRAFAEARGLRWREDSTNQELWPLRNRIRHRLLPLMESELSPGVTRVLARTADAFLEVQGLLRALASEAWSRCLIEEVPSPAPGRRAVRVRLEPSCLRSYHPVVVEEVLRRAVRGLLGHTRDLKRASLTGAAQALANRRPGTFSFPGGIVATINLRELCFEHLNSERQEGPRKTHEDQESR